MRCCLLLTKHFSNTVTNELTKDREKYKTCDHPKQQEPQYSLKLVLDGDFMHVKVRRIGK